MTSNVDLCPECLAVIVNSCSEDRRGAKIGRRASRGSLSDDPQSSKRTERPAARPVCNIENGLETHRARISTNPTSRISSQ